MSTRPLDSAFATRASRKSKKRNVLLIAGIVAGLASIGSVLAASISINSDAAISFSQGTTTIAACDVDGITAELGAYYDAAGSAFNLDTITLTGIAADCDGKTLTLALYDGTSKLATITGDIQTDASTTVFIGKGDEALSNDNVAYGNGTAGDSLENTPSASYESGKTAATLSADADRIVIEIN